MKISLCVICKNEERNIRKCLEGVSSIVDEMIVVDTGSTDATVRIAKETGANVYFYQWDNNFSNAKNYALEKAKNDWIIFLDADEYVLPKQAYMIISIIKEIQQRDCSTDGFMLKHISIDEASNLIIETNRLLRIFRKSTLRYQGAIHESVVKSNGIMNIADATGSDVAVYHTGYTAKNMVGKAERNLKLLLHDVKTNNANVLTPIYLSDCYMGLGEYEKSVECAVQFIDKKTHVYGFNAKPYLNIIRSLILMDSAHSERREWIVRAMNLFPGHPDFVWLNGLQYLAEQKYSNALETLLNAITLGKEYSGHEAVTITRVMSEIYAHIGSIYLLKNDQNNAFDYFVKALKENRYTDKAFEELIAIIGEYPYEETIPLLNSMYDDSEKDISFLVTKLAELRKGKLLIYYANIWRSKFNKVDITDFYTLYLNDKYEESFKMLCASIIEDEIDKVTQVYIVVCALLSMRESIIHLAWSKVNDSYKRILEVYIGKKNLLVEEDAAALIDLFSELVRLCSDEMLKELFKITEFLSKDLSVQIALILMNQKRYGLALQYFKESDLLLEADGLFQFGLCCYRLKMYPKAKELFEKAMEGGFGEQRIYDYLLWVNEK